jgi:hypothetical protein
VQSSAPLGQVTANFSAVFAGFSAPLQIQNCIIVSTTVTRAESNIVIVIDVIGRSFLAIAGSMNSLTRDHTVDTTTIAATNA